MTAFSLSRFSGMIGRSAIDAMLYVVDITVFIMEAMRDWKRHGGVFNRAGRQSVITQIIFSGVDALPTITVLSIAIGVSVTAQLIFLLQTFATENEITYVLTRVVALELGSLLTAIIVIGRSGSAIAVDLGNMTLNQEVEGLELLGVDVNNYFVTPRLLGVAFSQLALAIYFASLALLVGITIAALVDNTANFKHLFALANAFEPQELIIFLIKNLLFGLIIGATACFHGLRVGVSVTEVPQETQRAIVNSLILIFLLDGLFALLMR
jgi:phospholipid/cholesterol/gamma-HCH transport system permease protein